MAPRSNKKKFSCCIVGKGQASGALTSTSVGGSFVATRYEIDTTLCDTWTQLGKTFTKWRLNKLRLSYIPIKGTTTEGTIGICFLPDPNETTPTSSVSALGMRTAKLGSIRDVVSLDIRPKSNRWLFTRDSVSSTEDRLEMPGDFVVWTENTAASYIPGIIMMSYIVEFDQVSNSVVTPAQVSVTMAHNKSSESEDLSAKIDNLKNELSLLARVVKGQDCANLNRNS